MSGWVSIHRKLMESPVWSDPNFLKLWLYCLMKASHKEHSQLVGNQMINLEVGQFITGRDSLANELNKGVKPKQQLNKLTWFRHLQLLEKWEMVNIKSTNKYSIVTVVKYRDYQQFEQQNEQQVEHQLNNKRTTNEQQLNTNNNVNNVNNVNKEINNTIVEIIEHLNVKSDSKFKTNAKTNKTPIQARLNEKYSKEDLILVIDYCCNEWKGKVFSNGKKGDEYLQPSTLFNAKFDERLNKARKWKENGANQQQVLDGLDDKFNF